MTSHWGSKWCFAFMNCQVNQHKAYLYFQQDMTPINSNMTKNKAIEEKKGENSWSKKTIECSNIFLRLTACSLEKRAINAPRLLCVLWRKRAKSTESRLGSHFMTENSALAIDWSLPTGGSKLQNWSTQGFMLLTTTFITLPKVTVSFSKYRISSISICHLNSKFSWIVWCHF